MPDTLYFNNPRIFSKTYGVDTYEEYDLTGICSYASNIDKKIVFESLSVAGVVEAREQFNHEKIVKFDNPKNILVFKDVKIYLESLIFELPKNIRFINCRIELWNSYFANIPSEPTILNDSKVYGSLFRETYNVVPLKFLEITRRILTFNP